MKKILVSILVLGLMTGNAQAESISPEVLWEQIDSQDWCFDAKSNFVDNVLQLYDLSLNKAIELYANACRVNASCTNENTDSTEWKQSYNNCANGAYEFAKGLIEKQNDYVDNTRKQAQEYFNRAFEGFSEACKEFLNKKNYDYNALGGLVWCSIGDGYLSNLPYPQGVYPYDVAACRAKYDKVGKLIFIIEEKQFEIWCRLSCDGQNSCVLEKERHGNRYDKVKRSTELYYLD